MKWGKMEYMVTSLNVRNRGPKWLFVWSFQVNHKIHPDHEGSTYSLSLFFLTRNAQPAVNRKYTTLVVVSNIHDQLADVYVELSESRKYMKLIIKIIKTKTDNPLSQFH